MSLHTDDVVSGLLELQAQGRFEDLLEAATGAASRHPDLPVVHNLIGAAHAELGHYDAAIAAIRRAIEIDPENAFAHHNLGSVFMRTDRPQEAISCFLHAAELQPDRADLLRGLGAACFAAGQIPQAVASAREAVRLAPSEASHARALAEYLIADGADAEAIGLLEQVAQSQPDDQDVRVVLGESYAREGSLEKALRSFRVAADLRPDDADLFVRVGQFWGRHNAPEKELEALERAVAIAPDFLPAQLARAHALLDGGRHDEAVAAYELCLSLQPGNAEARHLLAAARGQSPPTPPHGYVVDLFDGYAATFDFSLSKELDYRAPRQVANVLSLHVPASGQFESVLDLGCGTGLFGVEIRPLAARLCGVDLSPKMIAAARRKGVYDRLAIGDIVDWIRREPHAHDAYAAVDVLIYVGALEGVFDAFASSARPGALFAFSVEHIETGTYTLRESGRYAHSRQYVEQLCTETRLTLRSVETGPLRKEREAPIEGGIYLVSV